QNVTVVAPEISKSRSVGFRISQVNAYNSSNSTPVRFICVIKYRVKTSAVSDLTSAKLNGHTARPKWSRANFIKPVDFSHAQAIEVAVNVKHPIPEVDFEAWLQTKDGQWWRSPQTISLGQNSVTNRIALHGLIAAGVKKSNLSAPD